MHMLPLERGLAISARKSGMTIDSIAEALHRDTRTLQQLFQKAGLSKGTPGRYPKMQLTPRITASTRAG